MPEQSWFGLVWSLKDEAQLVAFAALFAFCLVRKAGAPECILAGVLFAMSPVDKLYHLLVPHSILWRHANLGHLAIDTTVLACTIAVALYANRVYPLWIGGAQIIAWSAHLYRMALSEINTFAYDMMVVMPSYIQLVALTLGVWFHMSRRRRLGNYPSWRRSSPPMRVPAART
jgi:hypothetical protein